MFTPISENDRDAIRFPSSAKVRKQSLTLRQRRFFRNLKRGQTMQQAALSAGYSHAMARHATEKILRASPLLRATFDAWLEREGLSDQALGVIPAQV